MEERGDRQGRRAKQGVGKGRGNGSLGRDDEVPMSEYDPALDVRIVLKAIFNVLPLTYLLTLADGTKVTG